LVADEARKMAELVAVALRSDGYEADFSPASLWELDRFFDEQSRKGKPRRYGPLAKETSLRLFSLGAYAGEVIRRELGGEWESAHDDPQPELNLALRLPDGTVIWPVQQAVRRLASGADEALVAYAKTLGVEAEPKPGRPRRRKGAAKKSAGTDATAT
jgi:hypothetical protein